MALDIAANLLAFLQSQSYFFVFVLIMAEGPIVTYVASFAAYLGFFKIYIVWILSILATTLIDVGWYLIGRFGGETKLFKYIIRKFGERRLERLETYLIDNPGKTIAVIKFTPTLSPIGLTLAGAIKVPFKKFFFYSSIIVVANSSVLAWLGYYSGIAFSTVSKYFKYGEILIGVTIISILAAWVISGKIAKKISSRIEKI